MNKNLLDANSSGSSLKSEVSYVLLDSPNGCSTLALFIRIMFIPTIHALLKF